MNRRNFLRRAAYSSLTLGLGLGALRNIPRAQAALGDGMSNTLVNIMLTGGADLRYLFAPAPGTEYAESYWQARYSLYNSTDERFPDYDSMWRALYLETQSAGLRFGIHRSAAWLKTQFDAGNVAVVANVLGPMNRRHDHAKLVWHTGDPETEQFNLERDGWGGRLTEALGSANAVAMSEYVPVFCQGSDAGNRLAQCVHSPSARDFALAPGTGDANSTYRMTARALQSYYASLQRTPLAQSQRPESRFLRHERRLRDVGDRLRERLTQTAPTQPDALRRLFDPSGPLLQRADFGRQCASLYDSLLAADILKLRVAYMDYDGWDTHQRQRPRIEANLTDVFGTGMGLDSLTQVLDQAGTANDKLVYVFSTDFGRQLRANGSQGTDHGSANYLLLVGKPVTGGVYGEMFPASEISTAGGSSRYDQVGADIEGRTSFEHVLARLCDWVQSGAGERVFPGLRPNAASLEAGVDLSRLLA